LISSGQEVEWKAKHFGLWWRLRVVITAFDPPNSSQDRMVKGPFRSFIHHHSFKQNESGTLMTDTVSFASPAPVLGWLFDRLVLSNYLRRFLQARNFELKAKAEAQQWHNS
jgi:ligand-binding SRPBCC domain-containing protein